MATINMADTIENISHIHKKNINISLQNNYYPFNKKLFYNESMAIFEKIFQRNDKAFLQFYFFILGIFLIGF